ncbi:MAG: aspartate ammonia-lyase [Ignavibacteriae bacterium HGW-Ignavibacteriae-4]|jgi:aspartate ammonia-lyase|nr:MAG: aspartate ammonia-lyase [Ignavibacteriae bacterium HGW-Ignavibacteriae-4]
MSPKEISKFLVGIELFNELSDEQRLVCSTNMKILDVKKGTILIEQGSDRDTLFIIQKGTVTEYIERDKNKRTVLNHYKPSEVFGEGALMDNYPYAMSAKAATDCRMIILRRTEFSKMMETHTGIVVNLISAASRIIARRMRSSSYQDSNISMRYATGATRIEEDMIGKKEVPADALYGIQTLRAVENFKISGVTLRLYPRFIKSLAMVKMAAAKANKDLGELEPHIADAIVEACEEIISGRYHNNFVVDIFQGGAGTSTNMNANEVIANRALLIMGKQIAEYDYCHPNNHVNYAQSTNDVYPTALKITLLYFNDKLVQALKQLIESFDKKSKEFAHILKVGRTQLQDAVPMTLGQEFATFANTLREEIDRLKENAKLFNEINLGGTAIGTGLNANPKYRKLAVNYLKDICEYPVKSAKDLVEATQDTGAFVMYSSALKRLAIKLSKISNDLRLLSSGPRAGLWEINLPAMQPGSSIMPGKVNPVIPEVVNQIAYNVIGNDLTITMAAEAGQLQLNVMEPVIAMSLFESLQHLKNGITTLATRCIDGITANEDHLREMVQNSIGLVTALVPKLGYEVCSKLAKEALETGASVYQLTLDKKLMSKAELDKMLSPKRMV